MPADNVVVTCPSCGAQYEVPAEYLGGNAECSNCGNNFTLMLPGESPDQSQDQDNPAEIRTACIFCGSCFDVPAEYIGETAECPDCGKLFVIAKVQDQPDAPQQEIPSAPEPQSEPQPPPPQKEAGIVVTEAEMELSTNTIKISRKTIGMFPSAKQHIFDSLNPPPAPEEPPRKRVAQPPPPSIPEEKPDLPSETKEEVAPAPVERPKAKWWQFWRLFGK